MKRRIVILTLALMGVCCSLFASNKSIDENNAISSLRGRLLTPKYGNFSFYLDQEIRSTTDFGVFKDSRTSAYVVYTPRPWLKIAGAYAFLVKKGTNSTTIKHRPILLSEQTLKWGDFDFRVRERLESTFEKGKLFGSNDKKASNLFRTRLKIKYAPKDNKAVPYVYAELYNQINDDLELRRIKSQAGCEYKLTSQSKLTVFYQYTHYTNVLTSTAPHTIGALYSYTLKRKK